MAIAEQLSMLNTDEALEIDHILQTKRIGIRPTQRKDSQEQKCLNFFLQSNLKSLLKSFYS